MNGASADVPLPHNCRGRRCPAAGPDGTTQLRTAAASADAVHPVPKSFRSKERQS
ncbi:hypothetical protein OG936_03790 [Streptomyces sp. NBC_00846]|uniref:hypothetical protein n=1 Tax=Streptomyces sp. NBC_00846 TaxID=2975849 RepID=UPI00386AAFC1|nr:hypothetical protein OG936_03790 [Streptomyces sp. NBC_00846]